MRSLKLQIELITPCLIGSGTGYGSLIDTDIVFDELGIPYIPAKRVKGCLRDSAIGLLDAFDLAGFSCFNESIINKTFGIPGEEKPAAVYFSDLAIKGYRDIQKWLEIFFNDSKYNGIVNHEAILSYFTEIRQQTAIDKTGVAKPNSLRIIRVLKKGIIFEGSVDILEPDEKIPKVLSLSASNLRHMGTKRTRGFGFVSCRVFDNNNELNYIRELEDLCKS